MGRATNFHRAARFFPRDRPLDGPAAPVGPGLSEAPLALSRCTGGRGMF
jgi:hypothetical protein